MEKDKKYNLTPQTCGTVKKITGKGGSLQTKQVTYRCQDKVNCRICRYNFYKTDGREAAIKHAISTGASLMTFDKSDWGTVRKKAYRDGIRDYIKIRNGNDIYFIAITEPHERVVVLDPLLIDFESLVINADGRSAFKGSFHHSNFAENKNKKYNYDIEAINYLPVFCVSSGKRIPVDAWGPILDLVLYINALYPEINKDTVQDYLKYRAAVVASIGVLANRNWKLETFYAEKVSLDSTRLHEVTNIYIPSVEFKGEEIGSGNALLIAEILFGKRKPLFDVDDYMDVLALGSWINNNGETKLDQIEIINAETERATWSRTIDGQMKLRLIYGDDGARKIVQDHGIDWLLGEKV